MTGSDATLSGLLTVAREGYLMQEKRGLLDNVVNDSQRGWSSHARWFDFKFLLPRLKETFQAPAPALISSTLQALRPHRFSGRPTNTIERLRAGLGWAGRCCDPGTRHHRHIPAQTFWRSSFGYAVVAMAPAPALVSTWEVPATYLADRQLEAPIGRFAVVLTALRRATNEPHVPGYGAH